MDLTMVRFCAKMNSGVSTGLLYRPPFLKYAYVPESPALLEGSVLKNLMLGVSNIKHSLYSGAATVWSSLDCPSFPTPSNALRFVTRA